MKISCSSCGSTAHDLFKYVQITSNSNPLLKAWYWNHDDETMIFDTVVAFAIDCSGGVRALVIGNLGSFLYDPGESENFVAISIDKPDKPSQETIDFMRRHGQIKVSYAQNDD